MLFKVTTLIVDALLYPGSECHGDGDDIVFRDALPGLDDGGLEKPGELRGQIAFAQKF